jgi:hypothetical protein
MPDVISPRFQLPDRASSRLRRCIIFTGGTWQKAPPLARACNAFLHCNPGRWSCPPRGRTELLGTEYRSPSRSQRRAVRGRHGGRRPHHTYGDSGLSSTTGSRPARRGRITLAGRHREPKGGRRPWMPGDRSSVRSGGSTLGHRAAKPDDQAAEEASSRAHHSAATCRQPVELKPLRRARQDLRPARQPGRIPHHGDSRTRTQSSNPELLSGSGVNCHGPVAGKGEPPTSENRPSAGIIPARRDAWARDLPGPYNAASDHEAPEGQCNGQHQVAVARGHFAKVEASDHALNDPLRTLVPSGGSAWHLRRRTSEFRARSCRPVISTRRQTPSPFPREVQYLACSRIRLGSCYGIGRPQAAQPRTTGDASDCTRLGQFAARRPSAKWTSRPDEKLSRCLTFLCGFLSAHLRARQRPILPAGSSLLPPSGPFRPHRACWHPPRHVMKSLVL